MDIGVNIKRLRKRAGMRQQDLARAIGHKRSVYISRIERGKVESPGADIIRRISDVLGCTANDLLGVGKRSEAA